MVGSSLTVNGELQTVEVSLVPDIGDLSDLTGLNKIRDAVDDSFRNKVSP